MMRRRILSLLLAVALLLPALAGCSAPERTAQPTATGPAVIDGAGRVLAVPEDGSEERIASVYATAVPFLAALGITDQVAAVNCKSIFWTNADPNLDAAGSVGRGVVDLEALAACGATVLVHRANDSETVEAVERLGMDVGCISAEDMEGIYDTLTLLGTYFDAEERAEEVIAWMNEKFRRIDEIVAEIPEEERVTALVMGSELGRVAGGDMLQSWMIQKAGGIPVAAEVENNGNWVTVGVETIFQWDPEFLFCTSSAALDYTLEDILEGDAWDAAAAVQEGHVAVIPAKIDTWDMPGVACVLGTFWMLRQMYPDRFSLEELEAEVEEYYTFLFGRTFAPDYLGYTLS